MKRKWYIIIIVGILLVIQAFRIDKTHPELLAENEFITLNKTPDEIEKLLKTSCYDCHSFESSYPWYAEIAPVSWFIKNHINEGRKHLNFSEWGFYSAKKAKRKLEECAELVEKNEMPLGSYTWLHKNAELSQEHIKLLNNWFLQKAEEIPSE